MRGEVHKGGECDFVLTLEMSQRIGRMSQKGSHTSRLGEVAVVDKQDWMRAWWQGRHDRPKVERMSGCRHVAPR